MNRRGHRSRMDEVTAYRDWVFMEKMWTLKYVGTKAEVLQGTKLYYKQGKKFYEKKDLCGLVYSKGVRIVLKKRSRAASKSLWTFALKLARKQLGIKGFVPIRKGEPLYERMMKIVDQNTVVHGDSDTDYEKLLFGESDSD